MGLLDYLTQVPDNFAYVIPLEDEILHTADKPFCWDSTCDCHEDQTLISEVAGFVSEGLLSPVDLVDDLDYPGERTRMPTSAVRYVDTRGNQVIQRGSKRFVIHEEPPPGRRRKVHWLAILGIGMTMMVLLFIGWTVVSDWWTNHQLDSTYGMPRTYQVDEVVGHSDSSDHPSHFLFLNLNGHVVIVEMPGGDITHARMYSGPQIFADNPSSVPVTGEFKDVNGDGEIDLIVHIGEQRIIYLNDGTQFKPQ